MSGRATVAVAMAAAMLLAKPAASADPISLRNSFRIGGGGSVLCLAQALGGDASLTGMFDRGYAIVCRDAAVPIGQVHALRATDDAPARRLAALRAERAECDAPVAETVEGVGPASVINCRLKDNRKVGYRAYEVRRDKTLYSVEGLAGYDSALLLGLRTVLTDRPVVGEVAVALTGAGDPAAFARVQAGRLDRSRALAEAYRRNNAGSYAESAEFFASVTRGELGKPAEAEALVNEALQKSNLGRFAEADALLARATAVLGNDPLVARQLRNYRAMHLLNEGLPEDSLAELDRPLPQAAHLPDPAIKRLVIDAATAARLNSEAVSDQLAAGNSALLPEEKAQILDAQVEQLRGSALRLTGDAKGASAALARADAELATVRGGRLSSVVWMRAQILSDLAAVAEASGDAVGAERMYRASVEVIEVDYPDSAVLMSTRGRLAAFLARTGRAAEAGALFKSIVDADSEGANSPLALARLLVPYADLLLAHPETPTAAADLFRASQAMVRPGVAQTQAILARELSGGSDEASRLFRQSVTLSRQVERARSQLSRLELAQQPTIGETTRKSTLRTSISEYENDQVATQASLSAFPRFRAVSNTTLTLAELQALLRPGEAYYKMTVIDNLAFALVATPTSARMLRIDATSRQIEEEVAALRRSISTLVAGRNITAPFDVVVARKLYDQLFAAAAPELSGAHHLIFEPDGALLQLPPGLLLRSTKGLDAYARRAVGGGDGEFDFTGLDWLGRNLDISTSVSARSFRDVRGAPPSTGHLDYLGLGANLPARDRGEPIIATPDSRNVDCSMPLAAWQKPVSSAELRIARGLFSGDGPMAAQLLTGAGFSDTAIKARADLDQFRIIHFATHGIVTPAKPNCPAQPALMTSFGDQDSDGLLTFREIFDLRLDADLVILSACDTAGAAGSQATLDAGLGSGGGVALDGLVRAFVAAGGRLVIASHWPVPDDFDATQRLIGGLFSAPKGTPTVTALRLSQQRLMDDPLTSHPFYWAAFAVIGDGTPPVRREPARVAALH